MINSELEKIAYVYGDVCLRKKKQRRKRQKILALELLFDYAKNSTLHGLRYIVDQGLNILERCFWLLTVFGSLVLCSFYIYNVVVKWKTSPVIVTVNGRLASIGSVPLPAVTICPQVKVNPKIYNYTEKSRMFRENESLKDGEEFTKFLHITSMCDREEPDWETNDKSTTTSMVKDISEVVPQNIFDGCYSPHTYVTSCELLFRKVITEDGVCYSTNSLAASDIFRDTIQTDYAYMGSNWTQMGWSMEKGYNNSIENTEDYRSVYPRRGKAFAVSPDLTLIMINDPDENDKSCNKIYSGYKIYLHHPADFPQSSLYYYAALPNQLSSVAISFHELNSDDDLKHYDSEIRQCYFTSERELHYFKIYTATNCQAECLSNMTYSRCGCVDFYMPRKNNMTICNRFNPQIRYCMRRAKDIMAHEERKSNLGLHDRGCRCLPACNTVEYDAEILKTDFRIEHYMRKNEESSDKDSLKTYSKVELFYKKPQFVTMQRRELFGFTEMLANIGGLLGVFLGFSFLSLIEIFYFLTVRLGFILKRDLDEEKLKEKSNTDIVKY